MYVKSERGHGPPVRRPEEEAASLGGIIKKSFHRATAGALLLKKLFSVLLFKAKSESFPLSFS